MRFTYKATNKDGKTISGTFEGTTKDDLISALAKQGAKPVSIKVASGNGPVQANLFDRIFNQKVSLRDLMVFTRQLSTMVSAGVPLTRSLNTLENQAENKYFKSVIANITKDVESGTSLGEAFGKYPKIFNEVYVNMVKAGESGGILDEILKRVAAQTEKDASIRKKIKGAMTYPTVILSVTVIAFFGIMIFIIPKIGKILTDLGGPDAKLPIYTRALLDISHFLTSSSIIKHLPPFSLIPVVNGIPNLFFAIIFFGILGFFFIRYIRTPRGKYQWHLFLLKVPILKVIITKIAVSRFSRTFASLTSAGVTVLDALQVTGGAIGNRVIQKELEDAADDVKAGKPLSEPISKSKVFPPIVGQMLAVGEETGQIDTILVKVADFYDEEVDTVIDSLSSIIEPIMIIVLGSIVGLIAASVMGPIASLSQNVSSD
ncbi:type II secretion system F family protein [Candidatus Saccharibacteria bacterium]|nr:type II secretion system F family protein [Candidatus Saccharibacteria bacterium]